MTPDTPAADNADQPLVNDSPLDRVGGVEDLDALTESQWRAHVARSLQTGAARMDGMDSAIAENTRITGDIAGDTAAIREIVLMGRSFFSGLNKFAHGCARAWTVVQPLVKACTVLATAYAAIKGALYVATHGAPPSK